MIEDLSLAVLNWSKVYRHNDGLAGMLRCLAGERSLRARSAPAAGAEGQSGAAELDVVTFSVVPWLTALWGHLFVKALSALPPTSASSVRLLIGDCSGSFSLPQQAALGLDNHGPLAPRPISLQVQPCLNRPHGEKLDLFLSRLCRAELVLVSDDDSFWLDTGAVDWARRQMTADPSVAVVSLWPRESVSSLQQGKTKSPMGSAALLIRRRLWLDQGLSFRVAPASLGESADWFYDTGDQAELQLLERGFRVLVAPPEARSGLLFLEAISAWILKLQKHSPPRLAKAVALPIQREKAFQAAVVAHRLARILEDSGLTDSRAQLLSPRRVRDACLAFGPLVENRDDILRKLDRITGEIRSAMSLP